MARTNEWTETLVDWVDGRLRQNRFSNLWLGGGAGTHGGSSYRPIDGQLTQRHVCYDTSEEASPCSPSGFSSLVDNLRRIRYWQEPATWFGVITSGAPPSGSYLNVYIKPGLWYPSTTEYCAFAGGNSPTFTLPGVLDRVDTVYIDPSGILHIQRGTPAVSPTITLPPIASGIPLWAVHLTPTASGITFTECSGYYSGMGYIERDLRPFLNLGGGGVVASGVLPASNRGAILRGGVADWETYNVGAANEVLTNNSTDVIWSTGAINLTAGKTLVVSVNLTLAGVDGKSLTIEENSVLNQDLTTDASVTFADVFVPDGGTFGISGNELLTVNAAGNFTFSGVTSIVVPDGAWIGADADCAWLFDSGNGDITTQDNVGIGVATPNQQLTVEGTIDLKEQAVANADTVAYGQIWVKNTTPNELWFTDDAGTDIQLGLAGGGLPNVAGAGYVIVSTGVNAWAADQTPLWTGEHSFEAGIAFTGASGANEITVPDNTGIALELLDAGGLEYVRIVSTNATPYVLIDPGAVGTIKVGIGIAAPATNLYIYESNADTEPALRIEQGGTGDASIRFRFPGVISWSMGIDNSDNDNFKIAEAISVSGSTFVIQRTTHNIGIGIAAPTASLHVTGTTLDITPNVEGVQLAVENNYAAIELAGTTGGYIDFSPGDGTDYGGRIRYAHANDYLYFYTAGAFAACIARNGNVGIGTAAPAAGFKLDIKTAGIGGDWVRFTQADGGLGGQIGTDAGDDAYILLYDAASAQKVQIYADGVTFFNGGDVGIGLSPSYRLDVKDDVAGGFAARFFNDGDNINRYGIYVQCGDDDAAAAGSTFYFYAVDGDGNATGSLLTIDGTFQILDSSDESRKVNIRDTKIVGLDMVNGLRVRDYNWKSNPEGPVMTSFVAQEARKIFPAMVAEALDGTLMTSRAMLIPILTKAIQELDARLTQGGL